MGSWYENLKGLRKPHWITIEAITDRKGNVVLRVILQYGPKARNREIIIDDEVSFCLKGLNVRVAKGERWGDWGGPAKCGDVIMVGKKDVEKRLKDKNPVKVQFT
jgi:hypothetical protein